MKAQFSMRRRILASPSAPTPPEEDRPRADLSVVIPLYNHERYIEQALASLFNQSVPPREIIIINDGSTDRSVEVVERLRVDRPEIQLHTQPNQGAHAAINRGVAMARGKFVAILNSDDVYHPDRLQWCLTVLDKEEAVSAVATSLSFINERGTAVKNPWFEQARGFYDRIGDLSLALVNGNFFMTTSNLVVRRAVFGEIGFFSTLRYAHDLDFFLRLLAHGKQVRLLDQPLLSYRLHPHNTIREDARKVKVEWAAASAFFLYSVWRDSALRDWNYFEQFTEIANRHDLTATVLAFLVFFERHGPTGLACDSYLKDREFCEFIHRLTQ